MPAKPCGEIGCARDESEPDHNSPEALFGPGKARPQGPSNEPYSEEGRSKQTDNRGHDLYAPSS